MERLLTEEELSKYGIDNIPVTSVVEINIDAILKAQDAKTLKAVTEDYYCIPFKWCNMSPGEHFDGMGGCWGISGGDVLEKGRDYCKGCKYYRE